MRQLGNVPQCTAFYLVNQGIKAHHPIAVRPHYTVSTFFVLALDLDSLAVVLDRPRGKVGRSIAGVVHHEGRNRRGLKSGLEAF